MRRPLPNIPRGPRRKRESPQRLLLACPKISPEWELAALRALLKPQTKSAIAHRSGHQPWPREAREIILGISLELSQRLGTAFVPQFPRRGDFFMIIDVAGPDLMAARALAVAISRKLAGVWFTLDRLAIRDGCFFRRRRGYKLQYGPARDVHLPGPARRALRAMA
jgi:hypothetical protein